MSFRPRHLLLPLAGSVIVGLCLWKATRTYEAPSRAGEVVAMAPAPLFVERNTDLWPVKLQAYLGRHRILVAFFDGRRGADESPLLRRLQRDHAELKRRGWIVLAIGDADPIANREAVKRAGGFPFEVLADVDDRNEVDYDTFLSWGRFDAETSRVRPGLVVVSRTGHVRWRDGRPVAEEDPLATLDTLLER